MSTSGVNNRIHSAKLAWSAGGARIWSSEMKGIVAEAEKQEGDDQLAADGARRTIKQGEADAILAISKSEMSAGAWRVREDFRKRLPLILQSGESPGVDGDDPLSPENATRPVFLNEAGWPVPIIGVTGQPNNDTAEEGFYRLALQISRVYQSTGSLESLDNLPLASKKKLIDNAIAMIDASHGAGDGQLEGLSKDETAQLRSSAFTVLWYLGGKLEASGATAHLSDVAHNALVKATDDEQDKWLGKHMARLMNRDEYTSTVTSDQKIDAKELFEKHYPQTFQAKNILDGDGYISWEHVAGQGEGFFKSFQQNLKKTKVLGASFTKVSSSWGTADYELNFDPPKTQADGTAVKGIRVHIRQFNNDMMDPVGKKKGFSYGGHSNIGENQEQSLQRAMLKGLKASQPQIAVFGLCAGLDNLDDDLKKLGDIEVLTTFDSSYFWKGTLTDEDGSTFEGVTRSEDMESLRAIWESLTLGENYDQMENRVEKALSQFYWTEHGADPNLVHPTYSAYKKVRWLHLDGDGDGRMDSHDILFQVGLKKAIADLSNEFKLKDQEVPFDELEGGALKNSILDLNVSTHYNSSTSHIPSLTHRYVANGFFDGSETKQLVRFEKGKNPHDPSKNVWLVSYNSRLAHTSREAMEALTQYMAILEGADSGLIHGLDEVDRKIMGLTFAAFRLNYDGQSRMNDQRVWKQLLPTLNLPPELPYGELATLLDAEHHDYSGNMEIVKKYKEHLSEATLALLAQDAVGRPDDDPPAIA